MVPNLFPALSPGEPEPREDPLGGGRGEPDLFASQPATGAHEVMINAPARCTPWPSCPPSRWRPRWGSGASACASTPTPRYLHLIVNEGREAGASLPHTHSQLYALPFVPAAVARERERFTAYSDRTQGRNLLGDVVQEEVRRRERIVAIDDEAVALCPFGARVPFHMQVVPRAPVARFSDEGPLGARMLHEALSRLGAVLGGLPPLNMWVRTAPRDAAELLLAHRRDAAPGPARRPRDRHRACT